MSRLEMLLLDVGLSVGDEESLGSALEALFTVVDAGLDEAEFSEVLTKKGGRATLGLVSALVACTERDNQVQLLRFLSATVELVPSITGLLGTDEGFIGTLAGFMASPVGQGRDLFLMASHLMSAVLTTVIPIAPSARAFVRESFCERLLLAIDQHTEKEDDAVPQAAVTSMAAVNMQFANTAPLEENPLLLVLAHHPRAGVFSEAYLRALNHASERPSTVATSILMVLLCALTLPLTKTYFFTNDLQSAVDICARELRNLPELNWELRIEYCCVLQSLVEVVGGYKRAELIAIIDDLYHSSSSSSSPRGPQEKLIEVLLQTRQVLQS